MVEMYREERGRYEECHVRFLRTTIEQAGAEVETAGVGEVESVKKCRTLVDAILRDSKPNGEGAVRPVQR